MHEKRQSGDCVDSGIAIHNLTKSITGSSITRIKDCDGISTVSCGQDPMSSIVRVQYHNFIVVEVSFDSIVAGKPLEGYSQFVDRCPHKKIATDVTSV